jgi:hypothetical protein
MLPVISDDNEKEKKRPFWPWIVGVAWLLPLQSQVLLSCAEFFLSFVRDSAN